MRWVEERSENDGVIARHFEVGANDRLIPGVLWTPEGAVGSWPLVLVGHGGSAHKRSDLVLWLAQFLVKNHDCAVAAIDGPVHGDRRSDGGDDPTKTFEEFTAEWTRENSIDDMVADWRSTLDALRQSEELTVGPVGYWGLSMGSLYGVPLLANDSRLEAAVLGLWGLAGTAPETWERLAAAAQAVTCPLLFLSQLDDEFFPPDGTLSMFSKLGSEDKRLHLNVGSHGTTPQHELEFSARFLAERLHM